METRMLRHAKYRQSIRDMKDEDFEQLNKAPELAPSETIAIAGDAVGAEETPDQPKRLTPYGQYLRQRRKPFWIKLGFFAATVLAFVLVYFLVIARS